MKTKQTLKLNQYIDDFKKVTYPQLWDELGDALKSRYVDEKGNVDESALEALRIAKLVAQGESIDEITDTLVNDDEFKGAHSAKTLVLILHYTPKGLKFYDNYMEKANLTKSEATKKNWPIYLERNAAFDKELARQKR